MRCPLSDGESGSIQTVLTNAGFNGFSNFSSTFGTTQYEGFPALDIYNPHPDRIALWTWPVRGGI